MTFENCITLEKMMGEAQTRFSSAEAQLNSVGAALNARLGQKTRGSLIRGIAASVVWGVFYYGLYRGLDHYGLLATAEQLLFPQLPLVALGLSLALTVLMVISGFTRMKYFGVLLGARDRLAALRRRLNVGTSSLLPNQGALMDRRASRWELPLEPGPSIPEEAASIAAQLSNLEALRRGPVGLATQALYYLTGIAWTLVGACSLFSAIVSALDAGSRVDSTDTTVLIIGMALACVAAVLLSKLLWGKTDCSVTNVTLLATMSGPLAFLALVLVIVLAIAVVQLVLAIAAVAIAGVCLIGSISGG